MLRITRLFGALGFCLLPAVLAGSMASTEISPDGCTLYVGEGSRIRRVDLCNGSTLADFNSSPLPDHRGVQQIRVLPDGGLLVANVSVIARFNPNGSLAQLYDLPEHDCWSGIALDNAKTTFWAWSSCRSGAARFDLSSTRSYQLNTQSEIAAGARMFGGGTTFMSNGVQVNHGFDLHCAASVQPNHLQVVWGGSNVFFMESMTSVSSAGSPFRTLAGTGSGTINGQPGGTIEWTMADNGPRGVLNDTARIIIRNAAGEVMVEVSGPILQGSHTAKE